MFEFGQKKSLKNDTLLMLVFGQGAGENVEDEVDYFSDSWLL